MLSPFPVPLLGFAAYSGTGKTTLLTKLLPLLKAKGVRVGVIKHAHHEFDIDHPGKDSYELRKAGAAQMLVASSQRWALMVEHAHETEPRLDELLGRLIQEELDLILVEGFKHETFPKIELHRAALGHPLLYPDDASIVAVASDQPLTTVRRITQLDINNETSLLNFILDYMADKT
ncbi:MAG TPA: molybdopterin-guanine dinucleotide biosynthesis protein MobB [Gammaproteobacteria bacterium]|nr:molybdopterin-guanine dinucleotide biosynthesis protein MobB [Gammaproteobacteria bacterium]